MKKQFLINSIIISWAIIACAQEKPLPSMTAEELFEQISNDSTLVILDVRTPGELVGNLGHIDGVINIPIEELNDRIYELSEFKLSQFAVICRSGNRSKTGTRILLANGYKAKNVLGGMRAYQLLEKMD